MIADAIVLAIILLCAYLGYKKGFIRTVSKVVCFVISIVAARLLYPYVGNYVGESAVGEFIRNKVATEYTERIWADAPKFLQSIGTQTAEGLSETAISIVAIVAIIIITYLLTKLLAGVLGIVSKLPVISFANRVFGLGAGVIMGMLLSYALVALIIFTDIKGTEDWMLNSVLAMKMYKDNFVLNLIF